MVDANGADSGDPDAGTVAITFHPRNGSTRQERPTTETASIP